MVHRRSFQSSSRRSRPVIWSATGLNADVTVAGGANRLDSLVGNVAIKARTQPTITRVRGLFAFRSATTTLSAVFVGIIVVSEAARAIGVTAVPLPFTNGEASWLWWGTLRSVKTTEYNFLTVDSKAQRKINDDEVVVLVWENPSAISMTANFGMRILVKD